MKVSICIASRNHAPLLRKTLDSIFCQRPDFPFEVIVTDDGSTDDTPRVLRQYPVKYFRLENSAYSNGGLAKNIGLCAATGDIIIQQSDDVIHASPNLIYELIANFQRGEFRIATVYDWDSQTGKILSQYTGLENPRPLFFIGAVWREDVCEVGGYDPEFDGTIWYNDDWHGLGLTKGLGLEPAYLPLLGLHQAHFRPYYDTTPATLIYKDKVARAMKGETSWLSSTGPWPYQQGKSVNECLA